MSRITWAVRKIDATAHVYCRRCREVLVICRLHEAGHFAIKHEDSHSCENLRKANEA